MLLINGVIAFIGIWIAYALYQVQSFFGLHGAGLIGVCFVGFWAFLFFADVVEDKMIEIFNSDKG